MRINTLAIIYILLVLFFTSTIFSPILQAQEEFRQKKDWREGYSLILLENVDSLSLSDARQFIMSQGGYIAIMCSPHVMLGWINPNITQKLIGQKGIVSIHHTVIDPNNLRLLDSVGLAAVRFYNYVVSGQSHIDETKTAKLRAQIKPLINCVRSPDHINYDEVEKSLKKHGVNLSITGNTDYMAGTVAVTLFFVESNGQIDQNEFTWKWIDQQFTILHAMGSLSWWSDQALQYGESVTFSVYFYDATDPVCQQPYEPIRHPSTEDNLWISAIMNNLGFSSDVEDFNAWMRSRFTMDHAYSVFVGYNPSPAPDTLTDGYFAYTKGLGAGVVQMLYRNDGYGSDGFGLVLTHETGHVFWACDEYYQEGYGGCTDCGTCADAPNRSIENGNCEKCNPDAVPCMMRFNSYELCKYTPLQIGWQLKTWVDFNYSGTERGTFAQPYNTFLEGVANVPSGKWLWIKEGQSNETGHFPLVITKPMTIKSYYHDKAIIGR